MYRSIILIISVGIILSGCFGSKSNKDTVDMLLENKGTYVGDAVAIGDILSLLRVDHNGYSLRTVKEPYAININVTDDVINNEEKTESCIIALFVLVRNVENITFSSSSHRLSVSRTELNAKYSMDLYALVNNRNDLMDLLNK